MFVGGEGERYRKAMMGKSFGKMKLLERDEFERVGLVGRQL